MRASLMAAVRANDTAVVQKLVEDGADANIRTSPNGWSALHYAVRNGNSEMVQVLLKAGADPNYFGTMEGQRGTVLSVRPLGLARAAFDLVSLVPPSRIEGTLRHAGLDDPALLKSLKDSTAADRYRKVVEVLKAVTKDT
jgi:ankyrin repeat protein